MKSTLLMVVVFFCIFAACLAIIVTAGLSVGFVLSWMVPAIDLGVATLCGLIAVAMLAFAARDFARLMQVHNPSVAEPGNYSDDDDDDEELLSEDQLETLADQLSEAVFMRIAAKETWIRPRSKSRR